VLDQDLPMGIFQYARLEIYINEILNGAGDAAGNVYRHGYEGVDENLIRHTATEDLAELRAVATIGLERMRGL
jgi:hypothetical protein